MLVDMAKWAGQVGQLGRGLKQVTGQNGSFFNGPIGLWVKQVELENSDPFCHVYVCVTRETPLREVSLFLYPLVHFSVGFA